MNPDAELGSHTVILRTENTHHWDPAREARTFSWETGKPNLLEWVSPSRALHSFE